MREINNMQDVMDSRDIVERIEELEALVLPVHNTETGEDELDPAVTSDEREEYAAELASLKAFREELEGYCGDSFDDGVTIIRDSYFRDYAMQFADDIGAIPKDATWPATCIDWDQAARELQMDYTSAEFDGVTYWAR